jgi:hypothetical protein
VSDQASPATRTDPWSSDGRLWGRTYAIPFDRVWHAARGLAEGGLRGWTLARADDREGVLEATRTTWPPRREDEILVHVRLDENGQTRVDLECRRAGAGGPARRHARIIDRFVHTLDKTLHASPTERLDPTRRPAWLQEDGT